MTSTNLTPLDLDNKNNLPSNENRLVKHINKVKLFNYGQEKTFPVIVNTFEKKNSENIFTLLKPLVRFYQIQGIFPVVFKSDNCKITYSYGSSMNLVTLFFVIGYLAGSIIGGYYADDILNKFHGTNYYILIISFSSSFFGTIFALAVGIFGATSFCEAFTLLHLAFQSLGFTSFRKIKIWQFLVLLYLSIEGVMHTTLNWFRPVGTGTGENVPFIHKLTYAFASMTGNFIPTFITISFAAILLTLAEGLKNIYDHVETTVAANRAAENRLTYRQAQKHLYYSLKYFLIAFGPQLLILVTTTSINLIAGVYAILVFFADDTLPPGYGDFVFNQGCIVVLSSSRILVVLSAAEYLLRQQNKLVELLRWIRDKTQDKVKLEIDTLICQLVNFPMEIRACNVINLDYSFLSTAIPNVVTYILVLMQFKVGDKN